MATLCSIEAGADEVRRPPAAAVWGAGGLPWCCWVWAAVVGGGVTPAAAAAAAGSREQWLKW